MPPWLYRGRGRVATAEEDSLGYIESNQIS